MEINHGNNGNKSWRICYDLKERDKYEKTKENLKNVSENMILNNVNPKKVTSL